MKLFFKIFILLFISIIFSFLFYIYTVINVEKNSLIKELNSKIEHNKKIFIPPISALLYEYNKDILNDLLRSIYIDKEIVKIELNDFTNQLNIILNNKYTGEKNTISSNIKLRYNDQEIGILKITYTKNHINILLENYKNNILILSLIFLIISSIVFYLITKKLVSSLDYLSKETDKIADGDLNNPIYLKSNDEIESLAKKFEKMRIALKNREVINQKQTKEIKNLNTEMLNTQKKVIEILGEVIEKRYIDDPYHIKRVASMSYHLAILLGKSEDEAKMLQMVSPMHDVGKIGIPDSILLKPGKLTNEEFEIMKEHSKIGYDFLKGTGIKTLNMAANVAHEHHEKWDGTGYPRGLKKEEITLEGRITALADVFDALANKRCYKDAWETEKIITYLKGEKSKQFDPNLIDIFLENLDDFLKIQKENQK